MEFLSLREKSFGLDLSDLSLKFIEFKEKNNNIFINSFGERNIPQGIISEGKILDVERLANIVKDAISNPYYNKLSTKYVVCSLPEEKAFVQVISIPKVSDEDLEKAVTLDVENYVPLPISEVYFNYQKIDILGKSNHIDILLSAVPKDIVEVYAQTISLAGLIPSSFVLETEAIVKAVIENNFSEKPVVIIDTGATRTSFIIFHKNAIRFSSSISISANDFTKQIASYFKISLQEAEKIKIEKGLDKEYKSGALIKCCSDILEKFSYETIKLISYYTSHSKDKHEDDIQERVDKIIICGGGALLKGFPEYLYYKTGIKTEVANPWINIMKDDNYIPPIPFEKSLSFTTAIGLGLIGIKNPVFYNI
ncbi:Cell division protein FtsA [bacterium HR34]|nr:Cell division protein FtsA [bacterium HR34]